MVLLILATSFLVNSILIQSHPPPIFHSRFRFNRSLPLGPCLACFLRTITLKTKPCQLRGIDLCPPRWWSCPLQRDNLDRLLRRWLDLLSLARLWHCCLERRQAHCSTSRRSPWYASRSGELHHGYESKRKRCQMARTSMATRATLDNKWLRVQTKRNSSNPTSSLGDRWSSGSFW